MVFSSIFFLYLFVKTESSVITDILQNKYINYAYLQGCDTAFQHISNQKLLMDYGINLVYINNNYRYFKSYFKSGYILDSSCENWSNVLGNINGKWKYKIPETWLVFSTNISDTVRELSGYAIEVDSDFIIIYGFENYYKLYEFYNSGFNTSGEVRLVDVGYWNGTLNMNSVKRENMSGVVLTAMAVVTHPSPVNETVEYYLDRSHATPVDNLNKLKYFILLKYLRDMFHFRYKLYRTNSWGYLHNGTVFDGMVGALQRHEIDIGGSPVLLRKDRQRYIDYTTQVWDTKQSFIFRHPKRYGSFYSVFTRPLQPGVWHCTAGFLLLSMVALFLMLQLTRTSPQTDDPDGSWSVVVLYIFGAICQQGAYINRSAISIRIITFVIFLFALNLYQFYSASIVSALLQEPPKNIRTLEDLLNSPLKAGLENVLYNLDYFTRTTDQIALEIYKKKIIHKNERNVLNPPEGMKLVKEGGYAYHVDSSVGYKIIRETFTERETCQLQEVQLFPPLKMVSVVRQGLPYKELFAYGIRKMSEAGLMQRIQMTWDEPRPKCTNTPDTSVFSVTLYDFAMALLVLAIGMLVSATVLCCEILVAKYKDRHEFPFRI